VDQVRVRAAVVPAAAATAGAHLGIICACTAPTAAPAPGDGGAFLQRTVLVELQLLTARVPGDNELLELIVVDRAIAVQVDRPEKALEVPSVD
jgi:hypothetical protein